DGARYPFWSPDSHSIGFFAGGALKKLDLGGTPQTLAPATNGSGGARDAGGGVRFGTNLAGPPMRGSAARGPAIAPSPPGGHQTGLVHPQFLPDSRRLLFTVAGASDTQGIYLGGLDASPPTRLTSDQSPGFYLPGGWLLWLRAGLLIAQRLDVGRPALIG